MRLPPEKMSWVNCYVITLFYVFFAVLDVYTRAREMIFGATPATLMSNLHVCKTLHVATSLILELLL